MANIEVTIAPEGPLEMNFETLAERSSAISVDVTPTPTHRAKCSLDSAWETTACSGLRLPVMRFLQERCSIRVVDYLTQVSGPGDGGVVEDGPGEDAGGGLDEEAEPGVARAGEADQRGGREGAPSREPRSPLGAAGPAGPGLV